MSSVRLDFIIDMYIKDNPDQFKRVDKRISAGLHPVQIFKEWADKLTGKLGREFSLNPSRFLLKYFKVQVIKDDGK